MLGHFSNTNVVVSLDGVVTGVAGFLLVTLVADPHGGMPVPAGHAFRLGRAVRAEAFPAVSAVVFGICRTERSPAVVAVFYLIVRPPIRRRHLIRDPGGQRFRGLQGDVCDGLGDVRDTVDDSLRGVVR